MAAREAYHHGELRTALCEHAVALIGEVGLGATTLRAVARRAGVSHPAASYHFGDKAGLLTAVAVEGYRRLGEYLERAAAAGSFLDVGVAYVRFAADHPAHFAVMFRPDVYHPDDEELVAAKSVTAAMLYGGDAATDAGVTRGVAAWSIVHGFATLWLDGNIPARLGDDPEVVARAVAAHLRVPGDGRRGSRAGAPAPDA